MPKEDSPINLRVLSKYGVGDLKKARDRVKDAMHQVVQKEVFSLIQKSGMSPSDFGVRLLPGVAIAPSEIESVPEALEEVGAEVLKLDRLEEVGAADLKKILAILESVELSKRSQKIARILRKFEVKPEDIGLEIIESQFKTKWRWFRSYNLKDSPLDRRALYRSAVGDVVKARNQVRDSLNRRVQRDVFGMIQNSGFSPADLGLRPLPGVTIPQADIAGDDGEELGVEVLDVSRLQEMKPQELKRILTVLESAERARKHETAAELRRKIWQTFRKLEVKPEDIGLEIVDGRYKLTPKYRHPETGQTWAGRGMPPTWLIELEKQGRQRAEFEYLSDSEVN